MSLFRIGRVVAQDVATHRVRVQFADADDLVSWWLPVVQPTTLRDQVAWLPDLDEHVVTLLDAHAEHGVVLGAIYSDVSAPPVADTTARDRRHARFDDGTTVEYDRAAHRLRITLVAGDADVEIATTRHVTVVTSGGDITLQVEAGRKVFVGGPDDARQLATVEHVKEHFMKHIHPTPAGPSGPPILTGQELLWPHVTNKARGE